MAKHMTNESEKNDVTATGASVLASFEVFTLPEEEMAYRLDLIRESQGGQQMGLFDLPKVTVPLGGAVSWEVPDGRGGVDPCKEMVGVILFFSGSQKAYYEKSIADSSNQPPDCRSDDAITGIGVPGGDCYSCPFNQFGTARGENGEPRKGKACSDRGTFLLLREKGILPIHVSIPPTSLVEVRKELREIAIHEGKRYNSFVVSLSLRKSTKGGPAPATMQLSPKTFLAPEDEARLLTYARLIEPLLRLPEQQSLTKPLIGARSASGPLQMIPQPA